MKKTQFFERPANRTKEQEEQLRGYMKDLKISSQLDKSLNNLRMTKLITEDPKNVLEDEDLALQEMNDDQYLNKIRSNCVKLLKSRTEAEKLLEMLINGKKQYLDYFMQSYIKISKEVKDNYNDTYAETVYDIIADMYKDTSLQKYNIRLTGNLFVQELEKFYKRMEDGILKQKLEAIATTMQNTTPDQQQELMADSNAEVLLTKLEEAEQNGYEDFSDEFIDALSPGDLDTYITERNTKKTTDVVETIMQKIMSGDEAEILEGQEEARVFLGVKGSVALSRLSPEQLKKRLYEKIETRAKPGINEDKKTVAERNITIQLIAESDELNKIYAIMNSETLLEVRDDELAAMQTYIYELLKDTEPTVKTRTQMIKNIKGKLEKIKKRNDIIDDDEVLYYKTKFEEERKEREKKEQKLIRKQEFEKRIEQQKEAINKNQVLIAEIGDAMNNKFVGIDEKTLKSWDKALSTITGITPATTKLPANIKKKMGTIDKIIKL